MDKLNSTKKITLATLKAFAKRADKLFVKEESSFSGMTDCVEHILGAEFKPTKMTSDVSFYKTGIQGVYTVGSSRDYLTKYETAELIGIEVYNCCGSSILAIKKNDK
jgi:hypothetical protein